MKKKLLILSSVVLALIVVGGGYLLYLFQFKEYEVADDQIQEILEDPYDVVLPKGTKLVVVNTGDKGERLRKDHPVIEEKKLEVEQSEDGTTSGSDEYTEVLSATTSVESANHTSIYRPTALPIFEEESSHLDSTTSKPTARAKVAEIKKKYEPVVMNFHGQVDAKHKSVIDRMKNEYSIKKEAEKSFSYAYMYSKYMGIADTFEAKSDFMFNGIMESLEKDLEANGYNKAYSKSFQEEYEAGKKVRRDQIFSDAMRR